MVGIMEYFLNFVRKEMSKVNVIFVRYILIG